VSQIGTLRERPLHASLKQWYATAGDLIEVPVDGYSIDIVRGDLLIEIQTRGFSMMKRKVAALLAAGHRLRIVHPVAVDRWIVNIGSDGSLLTRRRSPRHGGVADLFTELVSFPGLLAEPGLEIEVLLTAQEEVRHRVEGRCWRRKGWTVVERRLVDVIDRLLLTSPDDLAQLLPPPVPARFTTVDLATGIGRPRRVAQQMAYCLKAAGVIGIVGKRGHSVEYELAASRFS
jgi:hypothetical protein